MIRRPTARRRAPLGVFTALVVALCLVSPASRADDFDFDKKPDPPPADQDPAKLPPPSASDPGAWQAQQAPVAPPLSEQQIVTKEIVLRPAVPQTAFEVALRPAYHTWAAGKLRSGDVGDVFGSALGLSIEGGIRLRRIWLLYGGWTRVGYGVGAKSAYANLATSSSKGDTFLVGFRLTPSSDTPSAFSVSPVFDLAVGYDALAQSGTDSKGATATVSLPSPVVRLGVGGSLRLIQAVNRYLAIEPLAGLSIATTKTYTATTTPPGGATLTDSGSAGGEVRVGFSFGISGVFDLALSEN